MAGVVICGVLEYFTSWYMERLFYARWWDYNDKPMNIHGRIWICSLLLFGLVSVVIVQWIAPAFFTLLGRWPRFWLNFTAIAIVLLMAVDYFAAHVLMNIVQKEIDAQSVDNTEEISRRVHELLRNKSLLVRRINEAYPDLQTRPHSMTRQLRAARKAYRETTRVLTDLLREAAREQKNSSPVDFERTWERRLEDAAVEQKRTKRELRDMQRKYFRHPHEEDTGC